MPSYLIVTETTADMSPQTAHAAGIELIPMHISFDGMTHDADIVQPEALYESFRATGIAPHTAGCSPHDYEQAFSRIHTEHPEAHIIHLATSAALSISFTSAQMAAKDLDYVTSVNTHTVSGGLRLIALGCASWIAEHPEATLAEVLSFIDAEIARTHLAFIPGDLAFVRAGGRLFNAPALTDVLPGMHVTLETIDGCLVATRKEFGPVYTAAINLIERYLNAYAAPEAELVLLFSEGATPDRHIAAVVEGMLARRGFEHPTWVKVGCVSAAHAGASSFGIAIMEAPADAPSA